MSPTTERMASWYLTLPSDTMTANSQLHELEISKRPGRTWAQLIHGLLFTLIFNLGCLMVNGFQFTVLLPLKLVPLSQAQRLYDEGIRYSKGAFGTLLGAHA